MIFARTDKLCLRRFRPDDLAAFHAYRRDPHVGRFQSWNETTEDTCAALIASEAKCTAPFRPGEWTQVAISTPSDQALTGDMDLFLSEDKQSAEIGVTIAPAFHRRGYASAAMTLAIGLAFEYPDLRHVIAGADNRNTASLRMIETLGFTFTHTEDGRDGVDRTYALARPAPST